jgi:hypothetical protein
VRLVYISGGDEVAGWFFGGFEGGISLRDC